MSSNKFCPAPWYNISTDVNGSIRPCCRFAQPQHQLEHKMPWMADGLNNAWNGSEMKKLRRAFINGEQPAECSWCWAEEAAGLPSYRENLIKYHPNIHSKIDFTADSADQPVVLDLKLSNVCNFKCRMCSPMASSLIAKELGVKDTLWLSNKIFGTENEHVFKRWLPNIRQIELTGGEPLVSAENRTLLRYIVESGYANDITLQITTNGSMYSNEFAELIGGFNRVKIALSVDDVGKRLEYARHGADWPTIQANMIKWTRSFADTSVYCTVNNYNIWYLEDLIDVGSQMGIPIGFGILHEPPHLSIKHLPDRIRRQLLTKYERFGNQLASVTSILYEKCELDLLSQFTQETYRVDHTRSESFDEIFPEWHDVIYEV